ncbi:hypothetical protein HII12_005012 [Brettanomyces bruxellensis]|uniref:Uncharacterized protein n=1 Tax=Dekkera bruxellensis TaxID=5007 RepID=A0A8H6B728_DEKBR|nr:hypothetical protein HII12_005012 [Brettanomyces bruxellensis]
MRLSPTQINDFEKNGCLVIPNFLRLDVVESLNYEIEHLYSKFDINKHPMTKFMTGINGKHIGNKYFLESSDKIHYFFEPDAFDSKGMLTKPVDKSINKIGHGLHILDKNFKSSPHTDSEFLYTNPVTCLGFWFALENCTAKNGCLQIISGSHKMHTLKKRFVRDTEKGGTKFVHVNEPLKNWNSNVDHEKGENSWQKSSKYTNVEVPAGSLVLIHGNLVHKLLLVCANIWLSYVIWNVNLVNGCDSDLYSDWSLIRIEEESEKG